MKYQIIRELVLYNPFPFDSSLPTFTYQIINLNEIIMYQRAGLMQSLSIFFHFPLLVNK